MLTYGRVVRPVLGITLAPPQAARQLGQEGVLALEVMPGSPAYKAGLHPTYRCCATADMANHGPQGHSPSFSTVQTRRVAAWKDIRRTFALVAMGRRRRPWFDESGSY